MSVDSLTELLIQYRYWILIPLSLIEGPVAAFIAGTLAPLGYFSMYVLIPFFFVRDIVLDGAYYAIGYFSGRTDFAKRLVTRIGVTPDHLERARLLWERRPGTTMFVGKLAYGISSALIVAAGLIKMPFPKFITYGAIVAVLHYGTLLFAGYFFGVSFGGSIIDIINNAQYVIALIVLVILGYYFVSWRLRKKFLKAEEER